MIYTVCVMTKCKYCEFHRVIYQLNVLCNPSAHACTDTNNKDTHRQHTQTHTNTHSCTCTHTNTRTHARAHAHAHTHTLCLTLRSSQTLHNLHSGIPSRPASLSQLNIPGKVSSLLARLSITLGSIAE